MIDTLTFVGAVLLLTFLVPLLMWLLSLPDTWPFTRAASQERAGRLADKRHEREPHVQDERRENQRRMREALRQTRRDAKAAARRRAAAARATQVDWDSYEHDSDCDGSTGETSWASATDHYGPAHKALREEWKRVITEHGAQCMETVCVMPDRRIKAGARWDAWDLAHDHSSGGPFDYLGPAHKACNQAEALSRGRDWEDAPTLAELLASIGYTGEYPTKGA